GEPGQASAREERARPGLHRLAGLARRPEGDRGLQDQWRAAVLPQCHGAGSVMPRRRPRLSLSATTTIALGSRWMSVCLGLALPAVIILLAMDTSAKASDPVLLHAAGSLRSALTEVTRAFEAASGQKIEARYGPSGT